MNDVTTTLDILITGLKKKKKNLLEIIDYTKQQDALLKDKEHLDLRRFNNIIKNKQFRIDAILQVDQGFEPTYERIRHYLERSPELYRNQINQMQQLIKEIGALNVEIRVQEERNNERFKVVSKGMRDEVKSFRTNKKAVTNYYKTYNKQQASIRDSFFDSKK